MEDLSGSRHIAFQECKNSGPGTVGAVIAWILELPVLSSTVKYEIASGNIGAFYQRPETRMILRSPWTDDNLRTFAVRETLFYQTESGMGGMIGRRISENGRFIALQAARNHLF